MGDTTLMFCVGATKSGTSWLYEALAAHPECHFRTVKELHYFDALEKGKLDAQIAEIGRWRDRLAERLAGASGDKRANLTRRVQDRDDWLRVLRLGHLDHAAYLGYLQQGQGQAPLIGDVTPAYALLPVERLRAMAGLTADVRFVYLMRDPVARLWSHVRMMTARRGDDGTVDPDRARNILNRTLMGRETEIEVRGDYGAALARLDAAVPRSRLLLMYYEDLFGGDGMARLCDFLGIARMAGEQARRVHAGAALDMPQPLRDKAQAWLAPQYAAVAQRMGRLPEAWQANKVEV